jgi:L-malate glycosyltransferase
VSEPKPIHVLFLAGWYPTAAHPALGEFIRRHAQAATAHVRVSVVYAYSETAPEAAITINERNGVTEIFTCFQKTNTTIPILSALKKKKRYTQAMLAGIEQAVKKNGKPDVIHLHVIFPPALVLDAVKKQFDVPVVISEHWSGYLPEDGNYHGRVLQYFTQKAVRQASAITVVSQRMETQMRAHGLDGQYSLLPNVVDTDFFQPKERTPDEKINLLHVSMLIDREKNISGLIRVMRRVQAIPHLHLDIVGGDAEQVAYFKNQAADLTNITFHGLAQPKQVAEYLQQADALVLFSWFEGMPVTIIEAQSCGLPVLATRVGHIEMMVREQEGMLVDAGDEAAMEQAIRKFAQHPELFDREAIRKRAIETYAMRVVGQQLYDLYKRILSHSS